MAVKISSSAPRHHKQQARSEISRLFLSLDKQRLLWLRQQSLRNGLVVLSGNSYWSGVFDSLESTQTVRKLSNAKEYQLDFSNSAFGNTQTLLENWWSYKQSSRRLVNKKHFSSGEFGEKKNFDVYFDKPVEIVTSILYFAESAMQKNKYLMQRAQDMEISPSLPGSQRYAMIGCAFDFLFHTTPRLQNALQNTRKKLRKNKAFVIGIHIRLGDKQFGRNSTRVSESDFPKYFSCATKVERKLFNLGSGKHTRWFLAADSLLVKDYARRHFAEKVIMAENKPEHLDIFKKGEKPPSDEGMMGVLHDHFMLAECDFLVLSESSFSRTAVGVGMRSSKTYTFGENCSLKLKQHF